MYLIAWTAAYVIYLCSGLILLLLAGCVASLLTTGRTRTVIQVLLALIGLVIALMMGH